jgi:outer membrane protein TolC
LAQDDVNHALGALSDARDQYIPTLGAVSGVGRSYGITLNVPTIVTINAQSLIFSSAQRSYVLSARDGLQAATLALAEVRGQVEEDAATTYLSLVGAQMRQSAVLQAQAISGRLVDIVSDRLDAGIASQLDLKRAQRADLQIRLQELTIEDEVGNLREHLSQLMGLPSDGLAVLPDSIPPDSAFSLAGEPSTVLGDSPNVLSAEAFAKARIDQAIGDEKYRMRPQFLFQAQYGRVSPINDVSDYYNLHGKYNTFEAGVLIVLPFFDKAHAARARETTADANRAEHNLENLRSQQTEDRLRLQHSIKELSLKASLAEVEMGIARDELDALVAQVGSPNGEVNGRPMTSEDEQNARLAERHRFIDLLDAKDQLHKSKISLLRQTGSLESWLASLPTTRTGLINH